MNPSTKKPSLVSILTDYLKEKRGQAVHGGDLEYVSKANGHEAETAKVRLREMTCLEGKYRNPFVEKIKNKDKTVSYRWIGPSEQKDPSHFRCQYCPVQAVAFAGDKPRCAQHTQVVKQVAVI